MSLELVVNSHVNNESNLHATLVVCNSCEDKDKWTFFTFLKGVGVGGGGGKVPHLSWNGASGAPKKLPIHPA